jgi:hypothetical protein
MNFPRNRPDPENRPMPHFLHILALIVIAQTNPAGPGHDANPVYRELISGGLAVGGSTVRLPEPTLADGKDASSAMAAIRAVAGDDRAARELMRDSVTAPFILKLRDIKAGDAMIRVADLWFVVHARLEDVDPERAARQADQQAVEAGNMRFESKLLAEKDLQDRNVRPLTPAEGRREWFTHLNGRLLDRIAFEATDRVVATRTADSLLVAARTEPAFDPDGLHPNRWMTLARKGAEEVKGPPHRYPGGVSYVKITRFAGEPGTLFVEAHFAFVEPLDWFQGNPILRSKISLIVQDQIRRLRRDLEKARGKP